MNKISSKSQKNVKSMGFTLIASAFAFYFFPDFALIDIFPDAIMYVLLCVGLSKLSYLNESLEESRKLFFRMILVSVGRLVAVFITFSTTNAEEQSSMMLLFVFVLALIECFFLVPAYINLFNGLLYLGTRHSGVAVFGKERDRFKKSASDKMKIETVKFVIIKNLALVFPETAALSTADNINSYKLSMYEFIPHFRVFGMIVSLIFGIIWLVRIVRYFRSLSKDRQFVASLCERYNTEILPNAKIFAERKIGLACLFFGIAAVLAVDFYIDGNNGYNIVPDVMMAISALFGLVMMKKYIPERLFWAGGIICTIYSFISLVSWKLISDFSYRYTAAQVRTNAAAAQAWKMLVAMSAVEAICFLAVVTCLILVCASIIKNHTGYAFEHYTIDPKIKIRQLHGTLRIRLYIAGALGAFAAASGVFRVVMFRYATLIADMSWVIEAFITMLFAIFFILALVRINEEVREKYMY